MPTSMWTRLSEFGILDFEYAERSYVNCVLIFLQLRNSDTWRTWWLPPLLLKPEGVWRACRIWNSVPNHD